MAVNNYFVTYLAPKPIEYTDDFPKYSFFDPISLGSDLFAGVNDSGIPITLNSLPIEKDKLSSAMVIDYDPDADYSNYPVQLILYGNYSEPSTTVPTEKDLSLSSFNFSKANRWALRHVNIKSLGECAKYVRQMMEAGGINTTGHPRSAYLYKTFLPSKGFEKITTIHGRKNQLDWSTTLALPGDIAVMSHGKHGHICMWDGKKWVSDFNLKNAWPYVGDGNVTIFRYKGEVT